MAYNIVPQPLSRPAKGSKEKCHFSASGLRNGVHFIGSPGAGKSRALGRLIAFQALCQGVPQVIFAPVIGVVDNLFDKINRCSRAEQKRLWKNIVYIDAGAHEYITPTSLFYRLSDHDTLFEIANRLPSIFKRQDPELQAAPILGWNALNECAINAGMITAVLGKQLDFFVDLVLRPGSYKEELKQALAANPALATAVQYYRDMMDPDRHALRDRQTGSLRAKLIPFLSDDRFLASFCGDGQGMDWEHLITNGKTVVIDLRDELDTERRQFKLLWYLKSFTDYIKFRGMTGRDQVVTLIIDEITQLLGQNSLKGRPLLADDLEELVSVVGRNYGVRVVISHQNLSQIEERIQQTLMQLGTQIIGNMASYEDARIIAQTLFPYDPYLIKKQDTISDRGGHTSTIRSWEFTVEEQWQMASKVIRGLLKYEFLVRAAPEEGTLTGLVRRISIADLDPGQYPDPAQISIIRDCLRKKCGVPVHQLIDEINQRRAPMQGEPKPPKPKANQVNNKSLPKDATIGATAHDTRGHVVPRPTTPGGTHATRTTSEQTAQIDEEKIIL